MAGESSHTQHEEKLIFIENPDKIVDAVRALVAGVESAKKIGGVNIHLNQSDNRIIEYIQLWFRDTP